MGLTWGLERRVRKPPCEFVPLVASLMSSACNKPATKIGTACKKDGDCNVDGQRCVKEICTKACAGQFGDKGCPIGYNCTIGDAAVGLTCNKVPFGVDEMGTPLLFGKSCATNAGACGATGDPNGAPACRVAENPRVPGTPLVADPVA